MVFKISISNNIEPSQIKIEYKFLSLPSGGIISTLGVDWTRPTNYVQSAQAASASDTVGCTEMGNKSVK